VGDAGDPPLTVKWDLAASQVLDPEGGSAGAFTEAAFSVGTALTSPCPPATAPAGSRRDYKGGEPSVCRCDEKRTVEWSRLWNIEPVTFHPYLLELCEQAVCEVCRTSYQMPSGPLHDATEVSRAGIPAIMMFVQCLGGISHNKLEDTREDHLELSVAALDRLASKTVD
jgi:Peptidase family M20/M25/M40